MHLPVYFCFSNIAIRQSCVFVFFSPGQGNHHQKICSSQPSCLVVSFTFKCRELQVQLVWIPWLLLPLLMWPCYPGCCSPCWCDPVCCLSCKCLQLEIRTLLAFLAADTMSSVPSQVFAERSEHSIAWSPASMLASTFTFLLAIWSQVNPLLHCSLNLLDKNVLAMANAHFQLLTVFCCLIVSICDHFRDLCVLMYCVHLHNPFFVYRLCCTMGSQWWRVCSPIWSCIH